MARRYDFKTSDGSSVIPVANGDYFTDLLSSALDDGECYIEFYNSADDASNQINPVTPTAGTIEFAGSPMGNIYLRDQDNLTVQASTVSAPDGTYTPPLMVGTVIRARMTLAGITGATHCRAIAARRA